uniref:Ribosome biogenesis protein NOP53 n=1 Tax=Globisporangium ultimum (strain ATCC 200006 / CBS 805.95 / DAOM BR144) TaxID=431595 RepID=K3WKF6_GLOUD
MTYSARHILQDIIREEKAAEQKQDLKKLLEEQKLDQEPELVRIGGKLTKIVRDTAVSFSEELTGNMRTLKPKGNPLLERFDSLHKRNMIQINGPMKTRKRKVKIIEAKK